MILANVVFIFIFHLFLLDNAHFSERVMLVQGEAPRDLQWGPEVWDH